MNTSTNERTRFRTVVITGGCGFIGTNLIRYALSNRPWRVINVDHQGYAASGNNLRDLSEGPRYRFVHADVCDAEALAPVLNDERPDLIMHLAAESHVDRSIDSAAPFIRTNVDGTRVMLDLARKLEPRPRFLYCSTDEVYGDLGPEDPRFNELSPLNPSSPYSASKAAGDMLARSYQRTYGLDVVVTRCSNNYGPWQFPEKLIPLMVTNAIDDLPLPVYGDGRNVRDWIHVLDHCRGMVAAAERGRSGEVYNFGGAAERANIDVVRAIVRALGKPDSLIRFVADRPGHDRRYAVAFDKAARELDWRPQAVFEQALAETIAWYRDHERWWRPLKPSL